MSRESVVLWECAICGAQFDTEHGGVCRGCEKPVCFEHLKPEPSGGGLSADWFCTICKPASSNKPKLAPRSA
jgi:hypothetical protein